IFTAWSISPSLLRRTKGSAASPPWRVVPRSTLNSQVQSCSEELHRSRACAEGTVTERKMHPLPAYRSFLNLLPLYPSDAPRRLETQSSFFRHFQDCTAILCFRLLPFYG